MALKAAFKSGQIFVRFAGVSGASAVGLGAYGSHGKRDNPGCPIWWLKKIEIQVSHSHAVSVSNTEHCIT